MTRPTSFPALELEIVRWAEKNGTVPGGSPYTFLLNAHTFLSFVTASTQVDKREAAKPAIGTVLANLIVYCALLDIDMVQCLGMAYDEMRRNGKLFTAGVRMNEEQ